MDNMEKLLKQAVQTHLSDEELVGYSDGTLDEVAASRAKAHMDRCLICSRKLEMMKKILQEAHRAEMIETLRAFLIIAWAASMKHYHGRPALVARGASPTVAEGQTEDGMLRWRIAEKESGELNIRLGSYNMELAGIRIILKAGAISKTATLEPVTDDQVGAEVLFTRKERSQMPKDTSLTIDILDGK